MASRILHNGEELLTDFDAWFNTKDLVTKEGDRYYHQGRQDDLVVCKNGENLNPTIIEVGLTTPDVKRLCLFADATGEPTVLASIEYCFSAERLTAIYDGLKARLAQLNLQDIVKHIALTTDELLSPTDFKVSRKKIAHKFNNNLFNLIDVKQADKYVSEVLSTVEKKIIGCFAKVLEKNEADISMSSDFFVDLGGTSLDYFVLLDTVKSMFNIDLNRAKEERVSTPQAFYDLIKN